MAYITTAVNIEYSDIDFNFIANPNIEFDVAVLTEIDSVRQSVLNILRTNHGEKLFDPLFGANLTGFLFEMVDHVTAAAMSTGIEQALKRDEPRVNVVNINIKGMPDSNAIDLTVTVELISAQKIIDIETSIERLR